MMILYYLPLIASRSVAVPLVQRLLTDIVHFRENERKEKLEAAFLIVEELGWNAHVYTGYIGCHFFALVVNIIGILSINTLFQNKFLSLVINLYPFRRDSEHFSDELSLLFPPFVTCKVGPEMMLLNYRTEVIGCHLTLMELYEKFFIGLWFWLAFLLAVTICQLISILMLGVFKFLQKNNVRIYGEAQDGDISLVVNRLSVGDQLVLRRLRQYLPTDLYTRALHHSAHVVWPDCFESRHIPPEEPICTVRYA